MRWCSAISLALAEERYKQEQYEARKKNTCRCGEQKCLECGNCTQSIYHLEANCAL